MRVHVTDGDLLDQPVDVIVNAWNRNVIPWWLLIPQGVPGEIKRRAGTLPFREIARLGPIPLGSAVLTSAGRLNYRGIIHVAGIDLLWRSSEYSVRQSVRSAMRITAQLGYRSIAFPLIGAGSGGGRVDCIQHWMSDELAAISYDGEARIVRYVRSTGCAS